MTRSKPARHGKREVSRDVPTPPADAAGREARLAAALRENLKRRKAQARGRLTGEPGRRRARGDD